MSNSFLVRKVNFNYNPSKLKQASKLSINPNKVQFINYDLEKCNIFKVNIKNESNQKILFKIEPPKKAVFQIKYKKQSLNPDQAIQVFVFFNPQRQKINCSDSFVIRMEKEANSICIPLIAKLSNQRCVLRSLTHQNHQEKKQHNGLAKQEQQNILINNFKRSSNQSQTQIKTVVQKFLNCFNQIQEYVKQKNNKNLVFLGEKKLTKQRSTNIQCFSLQMNLFILENIKKKVLGRYQVQFPQERPIIQNFEGHVLSWNEQRNCPIMNFRKGLKKLNEQVRKIIIEYRFSKVNHSFHLYKQFQKKHLLLGLPQQNKHEYCYNNFKKKLNRKKQIQINLQFSPQFLKKKVLDIDYGIQASTKLHHFSISPRVGFDDWISIQQSPKYSHEVMKYQRINLSYEWLSFPPFNERQKNQQNFQKNDINLWSPILIPQNCKEDHPQIMLPKQMYKIYNIQNNLTPFQALEETILQNQVLKEKLIDNFLKNNKESISVLDTTKYMIEEFSPYFNQGQVSLLLHYIHDKYKIIGKPHNQDYIDFQYIDNHSLNKIQLFQRNNTDNADLNLEYFNFRPMKQINYSMIIECLKLISSLRHDQSFQHSKSFNKFSNSCNSKLKF